MKKTIESIEKEINEYLEHQQAAEFSEDYGIQWITYYYTDDDDYSASVRMRVEDYVEDLICDVEMPAASRDDDDDYDDDDDDYNDYDDDDDDDYGDCTEDWEIKLCIHYGVHARDELDWGTIIVDVETDSVGSYIVYQLAEQIAEQRKDEESAALSIDNGATYIEADDEDALQSAIDTIGWDEIVSHMDDDAREKAHNDVPPCTELEYLKHYLKIAPYDLVIG